MSCYIFHDYVIDSNHVLKLRAGYIGSGAILIAQAMFQIYFLVVLTTITGLPGEWVCIVFYRYADSCPMKPMGTIFLMS